MKWFSNVHYSRGFRVSYSTIFKTIEPKICGEIIDDLVDSNVQASICFSAMLNVTFHFPQENFKYCSLFTIEMNVVCFQETIHIFTCSSDNKCDNFNSKFGNEELTFWIRIKSQMSISSNRRKYAQIHTMKPRINNLAICKVSTKNDVTHELKQSEPLFQFFVVEHLK